MRRSEAEEERIRPKTWQCPPTQNRNQGRTTGPPRERENASKNHHLPSDSLHSEDIYFLSGRMFPKTITCQLTPCLARISTSFFSFLLKWLNYAFNALAKSSTFPLHLPFSKEPCTKWMVHSKSTMIWWRWRQEALWIHARAFFILAEFLPNSQYACDGVQWVVCDGAQWVVFNNPTDASSSEFLHRDFVEVYQNFTILEKTIMVVHFKRGWISYLLPTTQDSS